MARNNGSRNRTSTVLEHWRRLLGFQHFWNFDIAFRKFRFPTTCTRSKVRWLKNFMGPLLLFISAFQAYTQQNAIWNLQLFERIWFKVSQDWPTETGIVVRILLILAWDVMYLGYCILKTVMACLQLRLQRQISRWRSVARQRWRHVRRRLSGCHIQQ